MTESETEIRYSEIEVRDDATRTSPGRLFGTLIEYGDVSPTHRERFAAGALEWDDPDGVVVNEMHQRNRALVRVKPELRGNRLEIDHAMPDTANARDALTLIRNKTYKGLSVEFQAIKERFVDGIREIQRAKLVRIGLVDDPSYTKSTVAVRERSIVRRRPWY